MRDSLWTQVCCAFLELTGRIFLVNRIQTMFHLKRSCLQYLGTFPVYPHDQITIYMGGFE